LRKPTGFHDPDRISAIHGMDAATSLQVISDQPVEAQIATG
jgi:hypothetical protein